MTSASPIVRVAPRLTEEFGELDFADYTCIVATTDGGNMGEAPSADFAWGLQTQRHIDVRTFNSATATRPEHWAVATTSSATFTTGAQSSVNHRNALVASLQAGTTTFTSSVAALDLTQLGGGDLTLALPNFPLASIDLTQSYLDLSNDGFATSVSLPFSTSTHTVGSGNTYVRWSLSSLGIGLDQTRVTDVRIRLTIVGACTFTAAALRVIDPEWVAKDVDIDNWNGRLRQCTPLDGSTDPVPNNQVLPRLWHVSSAPGDGDPRPIDGTFAIVLNTGSQTMQNSVSLLMRGIQGTDVLQLDLQNRIQAELNGPQPSIHPASVLQTWLNLQVTWGPQPGVSITRSTSSTPDYQWTGAAFPPTLANNTVYLAVMSVAGTAVRIQLYSLDQTTLAINALIFDTGAVPDSYRFIRRAGYIGWKSTLQDGDATIRSVRPESTVFAEYRTTPLASHTPVQGVRIYVHSGPDRQLWKSWTAVAGSNVVPGLTLDTTRSVSADGSFRVDVTQPAASGQGIISNILTPGDDAISGITNWPYTTINLGIWFPSAALNAGAGLSLYLLSQDGNKVPLTVPRLLPDTWQTIRVNVPPGLQSGRYQLGVTYTGTVAGSFWIEHGDVSQRALAWSARANPSDAWVDLRDELNSDSEGALFTSRGNQLQVRAQALAQDAAVLGPPKVVPVYAALGNFAWPDKVVKDPVTLVATTPITVAGTTHGSPTTFTAGVTPTPAGALLNWLWVFGDGSSANGPIVQHTYAQAGTYVVTLTVEDLYGGRTAYTTSAGIA